MIDQQSLVLLFFVAAMFLVAGSPCFAQTCAGWGELYEGSRKERNVIKDNASISKMNIDKTTHEQCPICASKETTSELKPEGEISGSVSVTSEGNVWLTIFLDDIAIFARVHLFERENGELAYRLVVEELERAEGTHGSVSSDALGVLDEKARMAEFSTQDEATLELLRLIDALGLDIQSGSRKAVPVAIGCGWRSPETTKTMIAEAIADQKATEGK
ncbi:MAG: hypothetical protein H8E91_02850 [Planctomycetes bacterium]|nr:hypothetical protein [Planctomycetota bacterium]